MHCIFIWTDDQGIEFELNRQLDLNEQKKFRQLGGVVPKIQEGLDLFEFN